jgi:hypothetical protein
MSENTYRQLAQQMDKLPGGFPATDEGLELRILRHLFNVDQAKMAMHLTLIAEPVSVIARRAGLGEDETREMLEEMAEKSLIYDIHQPEQPPLYLACHFMVGLLLRKNKCSMSNNTRNSWRTWDFTQKMTSKNKRKKERFYLTKSCSLQIWS